MFSSNAPIASSSSVPHTPVGTSQRRYPSSLSNPTTPSPKKLASVSSTHLHPNSPSPIHQLPRRSRSSTTVSSQPDTTTWGSNFWVTLSDPQAQTFYANPATGECTWQKPENQFVLPLSSEGEWWELYDEARDLPYYYHNKTQQTSWQKPEDTFVIPLRTIQHSTLGKRLSLAYTQEQPDLERRPSNRRSRSFSSEPQQSSSADANPHMSNTLTKVSPSKRASNTHNHFEIPRTRLSTIPGSDASNAPSIVSHHSGSTSKSDKAHSNTSHPSSNHSRASTAHRTSTAQASTVSNGGHSDSPPRPKTSKSASFVTHKPSQPQSLNAAMDYLSQSDRETTPPRKSNGTRTDTESSSHESAPRSSTSSRKSAKKNAIQAAMPISPFGKKYAPPPRVNGRTISSPILNTEATANMSPVKRRNQGKPIPVEPALPPSTSVGPGLHSPSTAESRTIPTMSYPVLPNDLVMDIQQFSESDYAKQYFSTHKTGFMFRRRVPVSQMMTWQKAALSSPLLTLHKDLGQTAVKLFKIIQHAMGDRERARSVSNARLPDARNGALMSSASSPGSASMKVLEEERWLLNEGILHGELRDEIYCQVMKQLNGNPDPQSVFRGWQFLCVLLVTFPPSKNFETYLRSFIQQRTTHTEGRIDVMAKYCLQRLGYISRKGPRGKPPPIAEIEIAADAAFNPSTFGESLDGVYRLQARSYPHQKIPIVLPFLADGILALGGTTQEGIFRVPGDNDLVSELRLRIDRGYYSLEGVDDPHVLASLFKLWLRELCDPLIPAEMYNECIESCSTPEACVNIVRRLPTLNRRVVLFVISFLQLFLEDKVQKATKMTSVNLALVMAPNLLRCDSDSMTVAFTNAQFEQTWTLQLLNQLHCAEIDGEYVPVHGKGAIQQSSIPSHQTRPSRRR